MVSIARCRSSRFSVGAHALRGSSLLLYFNPLLHSSGVAIRRHIEFTFWYSSRVSFLALLLDVLLLWCSGAVAAASVETVRSHLLVSARSACLKAITLAHFGLS
ncbi:hypothetical protein F2Q70_00031544 [Brassica cretica]|uniref:Uncharacterized protein n=1 Tax=Brassica cretica TaxID=69181 RepID=A0A8S9FM97_BRACR|nr:hypothetical protein F2Q70_00031544 [Brassica cretica]KAF3595629.1 hypothetical protein DY000_02024807 [Brassica cretica]